MQKSLFVLSLCGVLTHPADAQELYDFECCPNNDCQSATTDRIALTLDGYVIAGLDEVIPVDDARIRVSRDGDYHVCTRSTATPSMNRSEIGRLGDARTLKCLYIPAMS